MSDFRVREMLPSDLIHVAPLYREMVSEASEGKPQYPNFQNLDKEMDDFVFAALKALRGPRNIWNAYVALDGKVAKGFAMAMLIHRIIGQPRVYAMGETLFVSKGFRHRGLGEQLVRSMAEWAVGNGAQAFEIIFKPGTDAHKHWARMGFKSYTASAVLADDKMVPILDYFQFKAPKVEEPEKAVGES